MFTPRSPTPPVLALVLAAVLLGAPPTRAAGSASPERVARLDVRALVSATQPDGLWRALVLDDGGIPVLLVEHVRPSGLAAAAGLPTLQRRIDGFAYGRGFLTFAGQAEALDGLALGRHTLRFDVVTSAERLACEVPLRGAQAFRARCATSETAAPADAAPSWASHADVIAACEGAFFTRGSEATCLDTVARFPYPPAAIVAACDDRTFGDANALACLEVAASAVADPSRTLLACDAAMYGDTNALRCLALALRARWDPTPTIAACDAALYGDDHALRCLEAAVRSPSEMSRVVTACDDATSGDEATLACVGRSASL
ncbi:MAG: hypothetical protein EP329_28440 [Deltaproteobacteria bacterium]|nr:MAG: hypothetical protein EP329_28440 [Deltaproteobacteria bacterium]